MRDHPHMSMLEESNPFRGAGADDASFDERIRSGRRTAVVALVCSVLWGFGFLSLVGLLTGLGAWLFLRSSDARMTYRRVALAAMLLGAAGLIAAVAVA